MLQETINILEYSRIFALPTTILSWLIIFSYSYINSGKAIYGLIAFLGLIFVHLATNLIDDFIDYKHLIKMVNFNKSEYLKNSQKTKCRYLINGVLKEFDVIKIILLYLFIAFIIGLFLYFKCGNGVLYYALGGAFIAVIYPFASRICLSEIAVALAYGPLLFGGVYYTMTSTYSTNVMWITLPSTIMTVVLLYIHTVMDYEFDLNEGKKTIANRFDSQLDALVVLKYMLILAYVSIIILCALDIFDWQIFLTYLTIPLARDLYLSLKDFSSDAENIPIHKWYHYPMENMRNFEERGEAPFMIRIYQARNLMTYFSLMFLLGLILSTAI